MNGPFSIAMLNYQRVPLGISWHMFEDIPHRPELVLEMYSATLFTYGMLFSYVASNNILAPKGSTWNIHSPSLLWSGTTCPVTGETCGNMWKPWKPSIVLGSFYHP